MSQGFSVEISGFQHRHPGQEQPVSVDQMTIVAGEKVAIIGPSGCGKTTLLSAIAGILVPTSGSVIVGDTDISKLGENHCHIL